MNFNSLQYAIFLPCVFVCFWALPNRHRWALLLAASYYFYMSWNARYVVLILLTTLVSYFAAIAIERAADRRKKRAVLWGALLVCLGVLFVFKYFNFFSASVHALMSRFLLRPHPVTLKLLLPVGISFYTFQTLSYVIDVYRGEIPAERHFGVYAAFVSFFPQLVAGPIERASNLLPQMRAEHRFNADKALDGAKLMAWGFFKKIVVADNLAVYVDAVYADLPAYRGFAMAVAAVCFAVQIYCDFSGYSDIARGTAKLMDIELMQNFRSPYFAASIREFWSRWHISLSTWFRDYVYIPLGGSRVGRARHYRNLLITFLASGLWHGANWTFVIWGALHGLMQILEKALRLPPAPKRGTVRCLRVLGVFCFVTLAWVFFRAQSLPDALYVLRHMFDGISSPLAYVTLGFNALRITRRRLVFCLLCYFAPLAVMDALSAEGEPAPAAVEKGSRPVRWAFYIVLGLMLVLFSQKGVAADFIYFQF